MMIQKRGATTCPDCGGTASLTGSSIFRGGCGVVMLLVTRPW